MKEFIQFLKKKLDYKCVTNKSKKLSLFSKINTIKIYYSNIGIKFSN